MDDPTAEERKKDHIELAFKSQVAQTDERFYYEPLFHGHPTKATDIGVDFLGKHLAAPIWVSSMTGGTAWAKTINKNLALACKDFGMGMGLGSCRQLLFNDEHLSDFAMRKHIGDDLPFYANLGIAQLEELIVANKLDVVKDLVAKLEADGLIIHVNPLQEWLQPEGDHFHHDSLSTIKKILDLNAFPVIVKEVGQGMGKESLSALMQLPLAAIEFAAHGGTNFAMLELLRSDPSRQAIYTALANVGHTAEDMTRMVNVLKVELGNKVACSEIIISGGVRTFLDGHYLTELSEVNAIYGQASAFLKHARGEYDQLHEYVKAQVEGLKLAKLFLKVRK